MATILVTGGAGYVGAHACKVLAGAGHQPVVFDNLSTGWRGAVRYGPLIEGDLMDPAALDHALTRVRPAAVMHFAALSDVGRSMREPEAYWRVNVLGTLNLVTAMQRHGVGALVFSSTCATYGATARDLVVETDVQAPINPYGRTKRAVEEMLDDFAAIHGIRSVVFRYFNAAGADPSAQIGEQHVPETHLIPLALDAIAGRRARLTIHGTDYPTPDGTCVRDFIHVMDLAEAHRLGVDWLLAGGAPLRLNLGSGTGWSVRQVIDVAGEVTGQPVPVVAGPRREGDAVRLVSGSDLARQVLDWRCVRSDLRTIIRDAWAWHQIGGYVR